MGIEIKNMYRGGLSARRLYLIVTHLAKNPETETHKAVNGELDANWTLTNHLLASINEQLQTANYLFGAVNAGKASKNPVPKPVRIPRPGVPEEKPSTQTRTYGGTDKSHEEITQWFTNMSGSGGE